MSATFKIEGLKEVEKALLEISHAAGALVLEKVGTARLQAIASDAAERAPDEFGDLKKNIIVTPVRPKGEPKLSTVEVFAGPKPGRKAHLVEFGTAPHTIFAKASNVNGVMSFTIEGRFVSTAVVHHPGAAPSPFLRPAWDSGAAALLDGIGKDLFAEISAVAAKHNTRASKG